MTRLRAAPDFDRWSRK